MKILDVSAGNRAMWFNKTNPLTTFVDIRPEVNPDIVADTRDLPMLDTSDFDLVVFDPPHVNCGANSIMGQTYGHFTSQEIRDIVEGTGKEVARLLKPNGLLIFKWNDHDQKLDNMIALMPQFEPLFGQRTGTRTKHASGTYWVTLRNTKEKE